MNNYKSYSELQEELGENYPFKLYEMGISALKEIENLQQELQEIKKEHSIMKQFIYENGLWEKLLNDDRFIEYLRSE